MPLSILLQLISYVPAPEDNPYALHICTENQVTLAAVRLSDVPNTIIPSLNF